MCVRFSCEIRQPEADDVMCVYVSAHEQHQLQNRQLQCNYDVTSFDLMA
jgi:hypothetical protein